MYRSSTTTEISVLYLTWINEQLRQNEKVQAEVPGPVAIRKQGRLANFGLFSLAIAAVAIIRMLPW